MGLFSKAEAPLDIEKIKREMKHKVNVIGLERGDEIVFLAYVAKQIGLKVAVCDNSLNHDVFEAYGRALEKDSDNYYVDLGNLVIGKNVAAPEDHTYDLVINYFGRNKITDKADFTICNISPDEKDIRALRKFVKETGGSAPMRVVYRDYNDNYKISSACADAGIKTSREVFVSKRDLKEIDQYESLTRDKSTVLTFPSAAESFVNLCCDILKVEDKDVMRYLKKGVRL